MIRGLDKGEDENAMPSMQGNGDEKTVDAFYEETLKIEPDLIVGDFYSTFPSLVADKAGIPMVVNMLGVLDIMHAVYSTNPATYGTTSECCGCLCICPSLTLQLDGFFSNVLVCCYGNRPEQAAAARMLKNRITLASTFFGLDRPC